MTDESDVEILVESEGKKKPFRHLPFELGDAKKELTGMQATHIHGKQN
jgi:hypothetical protein